MTTIHVDTRTFHLRLPALVLGRLGTAIVLQVTEQVELRVERRPPRRTGRDASRRALDAQVASELDAHRSHAVAQRLGGL